jgi:hypothetical protein
MGQQVVQAVAEARVARGPIGIYMFFTGASLLHWLLWTMQVEPLQPLPLQPLAVYA